MASDVSLGDFYWSDGDCNGSVRESPFLSFLFCDLVGLFLSNFYTVPGNFSYVNVINFNNHPTECL